ncbi:serine hydrolase domain-containing protein [Curvivirga aplysinae]|uniref:serine hydrolase domain-containing protein n=1 Tax=Curvivirga aplysinae TaxID=2529852 RepID=UPI001C3FC9A1|nr:serine hydrolase domain-containing protein [Curvivirga aplysinae]
MQAVNDPLKLGFCPKRLQRITDWMHRYIDAGKLAGATTIVTRKGQLAYANSIGKKDIDTNQNWDFETILRFYSMTKPITSVAMMQLYEKGLFHLDDPVEQYLPELKNMNVLLPEATSLNDCIPSKNKVTIHDLFLHTAGFTYGFNNDLLSDAYIERKTDFDPTHGTNREVLKRVADLPLQFEPGTKWNYGINTDILGILVEVISGKTLDRYFEENIFQPLGMTDTAFDISPAKQDRLASLYVPTSENGLQLYENAINTEYLEGNVKCLSGGGGLLSTASDYLKFADMMRQQGKLQEGRILGPRTIDQMTTNHLPGDLASMGQPVFSEVSFKGVGFGLGVWSMLNPNLAGLSGSIGDYGWGGAASTVFWVDPKEDMIVMFLTQLLPSSHYPLRKELRALTYQSLID